MRHATRLVIYSQKGGVGKTTTAVNLGAALARAGAGRVTLIDLDPQMHLTASLGVQAGDWGAHDWIAGRAGKPTAIPDEPGLSLVPGHPDPVPEGDIAPLTLKTDWVIIDAAPGWTAPLAGVMRDCHVIISPLEADFLGLNGISRLMRRMQDAGLPWERLRLLICRYNDRLAVHKEVRARLEDRFGASNLLPTAIRNSVRLAEAPGLGRTIFQHAPSSSGATDYADLARLVRATAAKAAQKNGDAE